MYHSDYENEPIGGGNPYYRCIHCKRSDPEINGRLEGHLADCVYRLAKQSGRPYRPFASEDKTDLVELAADQHYESDDGHVIRREPRAVTPGGIEVHDQWVLRDAEGDFIDCDWNFNDLAERHDMAVR